MRIFQWKVYVRVFTDYAGQTDERLVGWIVNIFPYLAKKFESDLNS